MRIRWMIIVTLTSLLMWAGLIEIAYVLLTAPVRQNLEIAQMECRLYRTSSDGATSTDRATSIFFFALSVA